MSKSTAKHTAHLPDVIVERVIAAQRERIWQALTEASEIERWFFTEAETDPRPGGSYKVLWESTKDEHHNHNRWGKYLEFEPPAKLTFEWRGIGRENKEGHAVEMTDEHPTVVSITLTEVDGGTKVRLVHSGWGSGADWQTSREGHAGGWSYYLENLESVLLTGKDLRIGSGQRVRKS